MTKQFERIKKAQIHFLQPNRATLYETQEELKQTIEHKVQELQTHYVEEIKGEVTNL